MSKNNIKKRSSWFSKHPWLPTILTIGYIILGLLVPVLIVYYPYVRDTMPKFFIFISFLLTSGPLVLTILQILNFRKSLTSIRGLAILYLEIILMFGIVYFYAVSDRKAMNNELPEEALVIKGIDAEWVDLLKDGHLEDKKEVLIKMLECFHDSIHFSLITSTTVGYGDMVPVSFLAKSLVDIQVVISFFLISFGVAYFFSTNKEKSKNSEITAIKIRLDALEKEKIAKPHTKKNDLS